MAQKFTSLEDAADQLGISKDRLNQLREANKVRAYRDGASWKFRSEDIEKLASDGIPEIDPGMSDIDLSLDDSSRQLAESSDVEATSSAEESQRGGDPLQTVEAIDDLALADDDESAPGPASDLSLDEVDEPTVAGLDEGSDDALALDDDQEIDISKDSILLSEAELGGPVGRPPSTIIGKSELDLDADLDLSPIDAGKHGPMSDVKLAAESEILPAADDDLLLDLPSPSGSFEGLAEVDVDLETESSRIMSPDDVAKAQSAAKAAAASQSAGLSDLELAPASDLNVSSDVGVGKGAASGTDLAGLSALELDDDDEGVLGDGSDVTLSGESSGINIISPSDSGLALDEVPLDLSGSAPIGSSLDLGEVGDEPSLEPLSFASGIVAAKAGDEFQLTALGEDESDDEKDSSQVIALDEISEDAVGSPLGAAVGDEEMLGEDLGMGLTPGAMPVGVVSASETPFSLWNVLGLASCLMLLGLSGMVTYDLLRNMWSWDGVTSMNSSLIDGVLGLFQ